MSHVKVSGSRAFTQATQGRTGTYKSRKTWRETLKSARKKKKDTPQPATEFDFVKLLAEAKERSRLGSLRRKAAPKPHGYPSELDKEYLRIVS